VNVSRRLLCYDQRDYFWSWRRSTRLWFVRQPTFLSRAVIRCSIALPRRRLLRRRCVALGWPVTLHALCSASSNLPEHGWRLRGRRGSEYSLSHLFQDQPSRQANDRSL